MSKYLNLYEGNGIKRKKKNLKFMELFGNFFPVRFDNAFDSE